MHALFIVQENIKYICLKIDKGFAFHLQYLAKYKTYPLFPVMFLVIVLAGSFQCY